MLLKDTRANQEWISMVLNEGHLLSNKQNLLHVKNCYVLEEVAAVTTCDHIH